PRVVAVLGAGALTASLFAIGAGAPIAGASPTMVDFAYTGAVQTWVVPAGVTQATFDVQGAQGGDNTGDGCGDTGGMGGRARATIAVTPGDTISIYVGGRGGPADTAGVGGAGGFDGGGPGGTGVEGTGGGGGASDVRIG